MLEYVLHVFFWGEGRSSFVLHHPRIIQVLRRCGQWASYKFTGHVPLSSEIRSFFWDSSTHKLTSNKQQPAFWPSYQATLLLRLQLSSLRSVKGFCLLRFYYLYFQLSCYCLADFWLDCCRLLCFFSVLFVYFVKCPWKVHAIIIIIIFTIIIIITALSCSNKYIINMVVFVTLCVVSHGICWPCVPAVDVILSPPLQCEKFSKQRREPTAGNLFRKNKQSQRRV